ncbi:uncharacterized protein LOC118409737 [Branchiostoma floridae]|uniref:Uncharacterized protein LOC118409737 n=1 Tax=Branchiostoma floridae TaxID=7739 RepID=A0A9J7KMY0_BRAFL|nr:uncharacterized protein LOC118409737 [Branchiostoma floridae]
MPLARVDNPPVVWRSSVFNVVPRYRALTMAGRNGPLFEPEEFDHTPNMNGAGIQAPYHTQFIDGDCDDNGYGGPTIPPWSPDDGSQSHTTSHTGSSTSQPPLNNGSAFMQRPLATHETPSLGSRARKGRPTTTGLYMRVNEQTVPFQRLRQAPHPKLNQLQNSSRMRGRLTGGKGVPGGADRTPISSEYGSMYTKTYGAAPRTSAGSYKNKVYWYEDNLQKVKSKPLRHSSKAPV